MFFGIRWGSLRNKIIAWSFVPTAIILVAVALISLYAYQRGVENLVIERDRDLTRLSASLLAAELKVYTDPLSDQFLSVFDSGMVVFDARGKILAAEPERIEGWGPDWSKRIPFRQMVRSSETTFSNIVVDGPKGEKIVVVFVPLKSSDGESVGGIAGLFRMEPTTDSAFYDSIERLRRGESSRIYLVDGNGRVIYHSNPDYIGEDFSAQAVVQQVLGGQVGALRTRDFDGRDIVASFAPVPDTSWGLVSEESWAVLTQSSRRYGQSLLLLLVLGVMVPTFIVTVGLKRIMWPIRKLIGAAQEVAGGNFDQRITVATGDELEELAEQFNLMAAQLQESYDHLEREVANRTKELATLNTLAAVVSRSLNLEEILNDALDEALEIMGMKKGQAFLLEEGTHRLILIAHRGLSDELVQYTTQLPLGASTSGLAAKEEQPVLRKVDDYSAGRLKDLLRKEGLQLVISTPLMAKGKTVGAIDLGSQILRSVTPEEISLLVAIGHQIGVAVENARLYEQAQELAVVEERGRLARDLHDAVTQTLFSASLIAEALPPLWESDQDEGRRLLAEMQRLSRGALAEMRTLLLELRPAAVVEASLGDLLRQLAEAVAGRKDVSVTVSVEGQSTLPADVHVALYRIAQEALNNVVKHARASQVVVSLRCTSSSLPTGSGYERQEMVELRVSDDGRGFDPSIISPDHLGLGIMRERAQALGAMLEIESQSGCGTQVTVVWKG
ncbi:MAG: cache domain-containing protein [Chloroflexota bacterium]|nr:cache domain-containing protein [Chloroflexota bacterium]